MSKRTSEARKEFYQTFFDTVEGYEEKKVNGFWLIKLFDGNTKSWTVHLYSPESYRAYKGSDLHTSNQVEEFKRLNNISLF